MINEDLFVRDINKVHGAAQRIFQGAQDIQILDARPAVVSYYGGRTGFLGGHITGSRNLPYSNLINQDNGTLKSDEELRKVSTPAANEIRYSMTWESTQKCRPSTPAVQESQLVFLT